MKLLDTDICVGLPRGESTVVSRWRDCNERCAISAMSIGEHSYGAAKARDPQAERVRIDRLMHILDEGPATKPVMMRFGEIKADLESQGLRLADADVLIAATAIEFDMTLVTGNTKHFSRIAGLRLENWFDTHPTLC